MNSLKFVMLTTFYPPYHLGGACLHVYDLSNELAKRGHEVHIIHSIDAYYLNRREPPKGNYPNHERVFLHPLKSKLGKAAPLICGFAGLSHPLTSKALELVKEIKPDVVHHHNIAGFGPTVLDAKAQKVLYTAHDYWLICPRTTLLKPDKTFCDSRRNCFICSLLWKRPPQLWRLTAALEKRLPHIDMIISPSEYMRRTLERAGILQPIVTIPNFVPELEGDGEPIYPFPYFLFVGQVLVHKGLLNLVEAFSQVKNEIDASLLIVGSGSLEDKVSKVIAQKGCQQRIRMLGRIDDKRILANLYANALAVVVPSIWPENAPLVALEALACGTPVIVSDKGGLPEIANKVDRSLIFGNINDLKDVLIHASRNSEDVPNMPRKVYEEFFTPQSFVERYFAELRQ